MPSVTELWTEKREFFRGKTIVQIVAMCGDGCIRDGGGASNELRGLLSILPTPTLTGFAQYCLTNSFPDGGFVLQDIVNELGRRLGYRVDFGRYRGARNQLGHDGLWVASDSHTIVVEVKTTDAYRIRLEDIYAYRAGLIDKKNATSDRSSILIVVGRQDTGELEAQVRGSRFAWDTRIISVEALCSLVQTRERLDDPHTSEVITEILKPREFTRLDPIIDLIFRTARDQGDPASPEPNADSETVSPLDGQIDTEILRSEAMVKLSQHLKVKLERQSRTAYMNADGNVAIICKPSKRYRRGRGDWYWFTFHASYKQFLEKAELAYVCLICGQVSKMLLVPYKEFLPLLAGMRHKDGKWQVEIDWATAKILLDKPKADLTRFLIRSGKS